MLALIVDCQCPQVRDPAPGRPEPPIDHQTDPPAGFAPGPCRRGTVEDIPPGGALAGVLNKPGDVTTPTRYAVVPREAFGKTVRIATCRPEGPRESDMAELGLSAAAMRTTGA